MIDPTHLADIEAIRQLKARYFRHFDTKNWSGWRKVLTDDIEIRVDVTIDRASGKVVAGRNTGHDHGFVHARRCPTIDGAMVRFPPAADTGNTGYMG